ncbi:hypothetical protein MNBD_GAMMA15-337 [hydrothermal vent metagenome]|uniref:BON domain-containing protein n=1 Tax=hydrothermal vent metagenome TaxID=652676 RepID=A0A3B0XZK6_9ZZZZ
MCALQRCVVVLLLSGFLSACGALLVGGQTHGGRPASTISDSEQRDAAMAAQINRLFVKDAQISAFDVRIVAHDGVVQLEGHVRNRKAQRRAIELARSVGGVRRVESRLSVVP